MGRKIGDWFLPRFRTGAQRRQVRGKRPSNRFGMSSFARRLAVELLEDRRVLATYLVDNWSDVNDGIYTAGQFTLREAVAQANASPENNDVINFSAALNGKTILIQDQNSDGHPDQFAITTGVTINGLGAQNLTIDANDPYNGAYFYEADGKFGTRAFYVGDGNAGTNLNVVINGLTLTGGKALGAGGAIFNEEYLTVNNSLITGNSTILNDFEFSQPEWVRLGNGGGIASSGRLSLINSVVSNNVSGVDTLNMYVNGYDGSYTPRFMIGTGGGVHAELGDGDAILVSGSRIETNLSISGGGLSAHSETYASDAKIEILRSELIGNRTSDLGGGGFRIDVGAAASGSISVLINESIATGNKTNSRGGGGGGMLIVDGDAVAVINRSWIDSNRCSAVTDVDPQTGDGGGLSVHGDGFVEIRNSTISNNEAMNAGGIADWKNANPLKITNSTISGNTAQRTGGIFSSFGLHLLNSTVTGNQARIFSDNEFEAEFGDGLSRGLGTGGSGGVGVGGVELGAASRVENSIIAGNAQYLSGSVLFLGQVWDLDDLLNVPPDHGAPDLYVYPPAQPYLEIKYSLVGANLGSGLTAASPDANGNRIGSSGGGIINPMLGALGNNGGFTLPDGSVIKTHLPLTNSPAIDNGDPTSREGVGSTPLYDQRNYPSIRVAKTRVDIGAVEVQTPIVVSTVADNFDGNYAFGQLSLREAIAIAADVNHPGYDAIVFHDSLYASGVAIITLTYDGSDAGTVPDPLNITSDVTVIGPGKAKLEISGNDVTRVLQAQSVVSSVTLVGMTIRNGNAGNSLRGGGIAMSGIGSNLSLFDSRLTLNKAGGGGGLDFVGNKLLIVRTEIDANTATLSTAGGIWLRGATSALIESSSIVLNHATIQAGAMQLSGSNVKIQNTTISSNSAGQNYGGVQTMASANVTFVNATIAYNTAVGNVGGLFVNATANVSLYNTIVVNNNAGGADDDILGSLNAASSSNMLRSGSSGGLTSPANIILAVNEDAGLASLGYYGGQTRVHALRTISRAIDAGDNSLAVDDDGIPLFKDQRGSYRVGDWDLNDIARVDIGAFELAFEEMYL